MPSSPRLPPPAAAQDRDPEHDRARIGFGLYAGHLLTVWGLALSNALLALAALWSVYAYRGRRRDAGSTGALDVWRPAAPLLVPLGLYAVFFAVSILTSADPRASADELSELFSLLTLVLGVVFLMRDETRVRRVFDLLLLLMVALAAYGIVQNFFDDFGTLHARAPGPFSHYQTYAGVLLLGLLLALGRLAGGGWRRPPEWLALGVIAWALAQTLTRGAWVAAALCITALLVHRARHRSVPLVAAALVVAFAFSPYVPDSWRERTRSIFTLRDVSNYDRLCMAHAGLRMISERPLYGIGPDMVKRRYPIYRHPTAPRHDVAHLHNAFLQIAAEQGLLSLGAYLWLMTAALVVAWRRYRREGGARGPRAELYLPVVLAVLGFNLAGLFEANWRDTEVQRLILFFLAVPFVLPPAAADASAAPESLKESGSR